MRFAARMLTHAFVRLHCREQRGGVVKVATRAMRFRIARGGVRHPGAYVPKWGLSTKANFLIICNI